MGDIDDDVNEDLKTQRDEGDARSILTELDNLKALSSDQKRRWIWELLQNARDCFDKENPKQINIWITLTKKRLVFQHDGEPFRVKNLLAITRKTSTKPMNGEDGNTGKYGTGFVSTHVLSMLVSISGQLRGKKGIVNFNYELNRDFTELADMQKSIGDSIQIISDLYRSDSIVTEKARSTYTFSLDDLTYSIALDSILEFANNLSFTLLANPLINEVGIKYENYENSFSIKKCTVETPGLAPFYELQETITLNTDQKKGFLAFEDETMTVGVPVVKIQEGWAIDKLESQARIYKEFPLLGTESFHIPLLLQSTQFYPPVQRDGIRIRKNREDEIDKHADSNRNVITAYVEKLKQIFLLLQNHKVTNLHRLVETGLPENGKNYIDEMWYTTNLQTKLRLFFRSLDVVTTQAGKTKKIDEVFFPNANCAEANLQFFNIITFYKPELIPSTESYVDWLKIINQEPQNWPEKINYTVEVFVEELTKIEDAKLLNLQGVDTLTWFNTIIDFLHQYEYFKALEQFKVYPNQNHLLKIKQALFKDPGIPKEIKLISQAVYKDIKEDLIAEEIKNKNGIAEFKTKDFFTGLNSAIGNQLDPSSASEEQIRSIFQLFSYFGVAVAPNRNIWFDLTKELLPNLVNEKRASAYLEDFDMTSVDKWTLKHVCILITKTGNITSFSEQYFNSDIESTYKWLNKFHSYVFKNDKNSEVGLKYNIIPTQDGAFQPYIEKLFLEEDISSFLPLYKELYNEVVGEGACQKFLIDQNILCEKFRKSNPDILTKKIDDLFKDSKNIELVQEGRSLNQLFHKLNQWYDKNKDVGGKLFPFFQEKRSELAVKAFGARMSKLVLNLIENNRNFDDVEKLSELKLSFAELSKLEQAATLVGGTEALLAIADEAISNAQEAAWRKKVGDAAERAFEEAIADLKGVDIENPDYGFDFEINCQSSDSESYLLEIKSTVENKESIKMSSKQGTTSKDNSNRYALCVVARKSVFDDVDKDYFIEHARFITDIGSQVKSKVEGIESKLNEVRILKEGNIRASLENETYSVNVTKSTWTLGSLNFNDFVLFLKNHFKI